MLDRLDDTIVAVSSAPGYGALGIVRLTGNRAIAIADEMARTTANEALAARPGSTRVAGEVLIEGDVGLPAVFYVFRAPRSYTRQDVIEIHTIGSPPALELIRRRAIELGAIPAQPGEFTARAFLNGAMDLTKAEAVAGVISARTDTQLRASRHMMEGALSRAITSTRETLAELLALVEADIDFTEEPIEFITPKVLSRRLQHISASLEPMLAEAASAERLDVLPRILLFGPPNSGKSSLMNRLSGTRRAICAAAAGTTRDILSAPVRLRRSEAILLDTAGVDQLEDEIVSAARAMTLAAAEEVDLLCVVVDVAALDEQDAVEGLRPPDTGRTVIAANKADLLAETAATKTVERLRGWGLGPVCLVSALRGSGVENLRTALGDMLGSMAGTTHEGAVLLSGRQQTCVRDASAAVKRAVALAREAAETIDCADLLAFELREALDALGTVVGEVTTDDLLAHVFANFCIGK